MHIAFLTPEYAHEKVSQAAGIGTSVKNLATALVQEGVQVSLFVYGQKKAEIFSENGVKFHLIPSKNLGIFTWFKYRKYLQNYINEFVLTDAIDLVEAPDWTGITAFMNLHVPLILRFHGTDAYFCHLEHRKQKIKNFIFEKLAFQKANAYIAPTAFAGKITEYIFRIKNKPIEVIPSGLSLEQFHNPSPEQYEKGMLLYVGTIIRKKGVLELPPIFEKVLQECPEAQLILIGSDSFDLKTKSDSTWLLLQNDLNGALFSKVKHLGKVPYQQVQDYIKKANVCVFPTFAETQGMVTIEAMAMQKAVVNSDIGWSQELLEDSVSGYLVPPKNHELFAERIIQVLQNETLCFKIGRAAREKVEKDFDIKKIVKKNINFYQKIKDKK
jgi:glycosyltransferase involved in cell wall biosynthesis